MKVICLLLSLSFAYGAIAAEVVVKKSQGRIYLSGKNCKVLNSRVKALNQWSNKIGEYSTRSPQCTCHQSECQVDITRVGPRVFQRYEGHVPINLGLNCFSAALVSNKILPSLGYASHNEIEFWLRSKLCRRLAPKTLKKPGDLVHIENPKVFPKARHTFTYIAEDLSFTKKNGVKQYPYELTDPQTVYDHPALKIKPECIDIAKDKANSCNGYVQFYRCQTIKDYKKINPIGIETEQTWLKLKDLNQQMSQEVLYSYGRDEKKKEIAREIWDIYNLSVRILNSEQTKDHFYWKAIYYRADSLRTLYRGLNPKN